MFWPWVGIDEHEISEVGGMSHYSAPELAETDPLTWTDCQIPPKATMALPP